MKAFTGAETLYVESYEVFLRNAQTDWEACLQLIELVARETLAQSPTVTTLSVGCGDGAFDAGVIAALRRVASRARHRYVAIDINDDYLAAFRRMADKVAGHDLEFSIQRVAMEDFHTELRFDLIHLMHSLYYVPGKETAVIAALHGRLRPGGRLLAVVQSGDSAVHRLTCRFQQLVDASTQDNSLNAVALAAILRDLGLAHERVDLPFSVDVSSCFDDDSSDGQRLLSFLCQADLVHAPVELREIMRMELAGELASGSNDRHLRLDTCAFVI